MEFIRKPIFKEGKKYTFKDYFELPNPTEEIIKELGYSYSLGIIDLPKSTRSDLSYINALKDNYYQVLPKINLASVVSVGCISDSVMHRFDMGKVYDASAYTPYAR